ncbi:hypothetical protein BL253_07515 [Pseudofrankia asymbiotica]|uniref:Uncharacterized protein n=2 Tax=Pseudofrankia asymbiotica TaxID=1834516 RepID=A0A1V2IHQ5_9ACTN|nr:hypothetical protein BL253_07515 [Pseudofrankia asymbiotica]
MEVDGRLVALISRGEETRIAVPPGSHRVRAWTSWIPSHPVIVGVADGETATMAVAGRGDTATSQFLSGCRGPRLTADRAEGGSGGPPTAPADLRGRSWVALFMYVTYALQLLGLLAVINGVAAHDTARVALIVAGTVLLVGCWAARRPWGHRAAPR